jgi:hypothetical protein
VCNKTRLSDFDKQIHISDDLLLVIQIVSALHKWLRCTTVNTTPLQGSVGEWDLDTSDVNSGTQRFEITLSGVHHVGSNHF